MITRHTHRHLHDRGLHRRLWHAHEHAHAAGRHVPGQPRPLEHARRPADQSHAHGHRGAA